MAQSNIHVVVEKFTSFPGLGVWDTLQVIDFCYSGGQLDSVFSSEGSSWHKHIRKFESWTSSVPHIIEGSIDQLPRSFSQLRMQGKVPRKINHFDAVGNEVKLWWLDSIHVADERTHSVLHLEPLRFESNWDGEFYGFDSAGAIILYKKIMFTNGYERVVSEKRREIVYDSSGKVQRIVRWGGQEGRLALFDTMLFIYNGDSLVSSKRAYYGGEDTTFKFTELVEFGGWQQFETETKPFLYSDFPVGGQGYKRYSRYRHHPGNQLRFVEFRDKQYDHSGRLTHDISKDSLGNTVIIEYDYYDNGDLKLVRNGRNFPRDTFWTAEKYDNIYSADGSLVRSTYYQQDRDSIRYSFIYQRLGVSRPSLTLPESSYGRVLEVPSGTQCVTVVDILGSPRIDAVGVGTWLEMFTLPSGLYFISIDGGKPRKHLIP
jgi:hypothetical protein